MLATEARKKASEAIWNSLPSILKHSIEDAISEGKFECKITFNRDDADDVDKFLKNSKYLHLLDTLGYRTAMYRESDKYVITITW